VNHEGFTGRRTLFPAPLGPLLRAGLYSHSKWRGGSLAERARVESFRRTIVRAPQSELTGDSARSARSARSACMHTHPERASPTLWRELEGAARLELTQTTLLTRALAITPATAASHPRPLSARGGKPSRAYLEELKQIGVCSPRASDDHLHACAACAPCADLRVPPGVPSRRFLRLTEGGPSRRHAGSITGPPLFTTAAALWLSRTNRCVRTSPKCWVNRIVTALLLAGNISTFGWRKCELG
jgi:hypothetical protein